MSEAQVFQAISICIAIVSLAWAAFVTIRKGDISRPTLKVTLGLTGISKIARSESKSMRIERSTLILAARLHSDETGFFPLFLCIKNVGATAVRNVRVTLDYPTEHYLSDLSQVLHFKFADKRKIKLGSAEQRSASTFGRMTTVVHELGLLRPGEGNILTEVVIWRASPAVDVTSEQKLDTLPLETLPLETRLERVGVSGYFPLHVFVAAENCPPTASRFNILWINDELTPQDGVAVGAIIHRITRGLWGRMPSPGFYWRPWPSKPIMRWEGAEILLLDLMKATHNGRTYQVAEFEPVGYGLAKIPMPTWNYRDELRPNLEAARSPFLSRIVGWRASSPRSGRRRNREP